MTMSDVTKTLNFNAWVDEHGPSLKPPVANKEMFPGHEDFIVMVVGGPTRPRRQDCCPRRGVPSGAMLSLPRSTARPGASGTPPGDPRAPWVGLTTPRPAAQRRAWAGPRSSRAQRSPANSTQPATLMRLS